MTDQQRAAMQAALEALEKFIRFAAIMTDGPDASDKVFAEDFAEAGFLQAAAVIPALRAELAQPEQQPVAWGVRGTDGQIVDTCSDASKRRSAAQWVGAFNVPLYLHAQPEQQADEVCDGTRGALCSSQDPNQCNRERDCPGWKQPEQQEKNHE